MGPDEDRTHCSSNDQRNYICKQFFTTGHPDMIYSYEADIITVLERIFYFYFFFVGLLDFNNFYSTSQLFLLNFSFFFLFSSSFHNYRFFAFIVPFLLLLLRYRCSRRLRPCLFVFFFLFILLYPRVLVCSSIRF